VMAVAVPPALALGSHGRDRRSMLAGESAATSATDRTAGGPDADGRDSPEPGLAL